MEKVEAGIVLTGTEVKSLRNGKANLEDAYAEVNGGEIWLIGCDIPEYLQANRMNHVPKRPRKLLLHRREIIKLDNKTGEKGMTIVPLSIYFKKGMAKVELSIARGRKTFDKREALKKQDAKRDRSGPAAAVNCRSARIQRQPRAADSAPNGSRIWVVHFDCALTKCSRRGVPMSASLEEPRISQPHRRDALRLMAGGIFGCTVERASRAFAWRTGAAPVDDHRTEGDPDRTARPAAAGRQRLPRAVFPPQRRRIADRWRESSASAKRTAAKM